MSQNTLLYSELASGDQYFNLARDLSWVNSKNHEHSDRDGHVVGYLVNVKVHGTAKNTIALKGAGNTWKMRNAFRKWHAYRDLMFTEAGVTESEMGRYGKTIRPYLDPSMITGVIKDPLGWNVSGTPPVQTQEWTYTEIASNPAFSAAATGSDGQSLVDLYQLTICGTNQVGTTSPKGSETYTSVAMIHSYNLDRQEIVTPSLASETVVGPNNPLALLRQGGSVAGGEVMDIVQDQEFEAPPYDITDNGASTFVAPFDIMQINPGYDGSGSVPVLRSTTLFVPAGILAMNCLVSDSDASILIEVVDTILCKDMA